MENYSFIIEQKSEEIKQLKESFNSKFNEKEE